MRRLAVLVVLLGGCDAADAGESDDGDESSSSGIDVSDGDTFSEESESSGGAPEYADGEMFGFCEANEDCIGFDPDANNAIRCIASTCVERFTGASAEGEPTLCAHPDASAVVTSDISNSYTTCGLTARVADGLGYCPGGMTLASWVASDDQYSTTTCWWSPEVVSGPMCFTDDQCGACEPQPYEAGGLPNICR
jgi:hypothetical protein